MSTLEDKRKLDDPLNVEGLAAQLYVQSRKGDHYAWWHVMSEALKQKFREEAKAKIADFRSKTPF